MQTHLLLVTIADLGIYVAMAAATGAFTWDAEELLSWGGNLGALSLHGQPWRLLVRTCLHAGHQHILGNLILPGITGACVEPRIGSWTSEVSGRRIAQTVGINALYSLAPDVDWLAHLGGFLAGLACGGALLAYRPQ